MEMKLDFLAWLSKKICLISVGLYVTICVVIALPVFLTKIFGLSPFVSSFLAFFVVAFLRAAYESLIIYEATIKSLSLPKMVVLSFATAATMACAAVFLKPKVGYFSIPLALIISLKVVGSLKKSLWPSHERLGFFAALPAKLELINLGRYGFYAFLIGITYFAYAKHGVSFILAFSAAFFIGMMFEEIYMVIKVYEQDLTTKPFIAMILWSLICAFLSTAIVVVMMKQCGYAGQSATIVGVVLLKLVQPFGSRKFILGL